MSDFKVCAACEFCVPKQSFLGAVNGKEAYGTEYKDAICIHPRLCLVLPALSMTKCIDERVDIVNVDTCGVGGKYFIERPIQEEDTNVKPS